MAWVEKDHNDHPVSAPLLCAGLPTARPDQAAQSHIQPGLECLQGWGIHSLLGQPVPVIFQQYCSFILHLQVPDREVGIHKPSKSFSDFILQQILLKF